jgi:transcriptional regulator with XRE-family HTH domain
MSKSVAELVNELFRTYRKSDGTEFSNSEVSRATNQAVSPSLLSKLRRGEVPNPGRNALLALCQFFGVQPNYFFPEIDLPRATDGGTPEEPAALAAALRATNLDPEVRQKLAELLFALTKTK